MSKIYKKGFYVWDKTLNDFRLLVRAEINSWLEVSTFEGIVGNNGTLYILTNDCIVSSKEYKKGLYTYNTTNGFVMVSSDSQVFYDTDDLTTITKPSKQIIYRLSIKNGYVYKHNNVEVDKDVLVGYVSMDYNVFDYYIDAEEKVQPKVNNVETTWGDLTDTTIEELVNNNSLAIFTGDNIDTEYNHIEFFRVGVDTYDYKDTITREDWISGYKLYHNPTETSGVDNFIEIGSEIEDNSITNEKLATDVKIGSLQDLRTNNKTNITNAINEITIKDIDTFPTTNISKWTIYRKIDYKYKHQGIDIEEPTGYKQSEESTVEITADEEGVSIVDGGISQEVLYENITDELIAGWITNGYIEECDFEAAIFFYFSETVEETTTTGYDYKDNFAKVPQYNLYHNPTETAGVSNFKQINGGSGGSGDVNIDEITIVKNNNNEIQANAIIDCGSALPTSNILKGSYYVKTETTPITMIKIFTYDGLNWKSHSTINLNSLDIYDSLTNEQKTDGTIYVIKGSGSIITEWDYTTLENKPKINSITLLNNITLEDLDLYSRSEIITLLQGKGEPEFVTALPQDPQNNYWYYSKKYEDGTDVPNDKRALYIYKNNVWNYMGLAGDAALTDYYTKVEADERFASKTDLNNAIERIVGTETTLWSGNQQTGIIGFAEDWHNFDYIRFEYKCIYNSTSTFNYQSTWSVKDMAGRTNLNIMLSTSWDQSSRYVQLQAFTSGQVNLYTGGDSYLNKVVGIKGNIDIQKIPTVKTMTVTGYKTDGAGYLKNSSGYAFEIPGTLIGCKILNPTSAMINGGMKQVILQNSSPSKLNLWSVHLSTWDGNNYANITGLNAELHYV